MSALKLSDKILKHYNISDYSTPKSGGQKTVFIVTIEEEKYALKVINIADKRFEREVKICKKYSGYYGIPKLIHIETIGKDTIILEEFIDGNDLCDVSTTFHKDETKICELLSKVTTIMKPIWEDNYVHRDLKPQNIRIRNDGIPFVLDFGIARALDEDSITSAGGQPLTYLFASPEQYAGNKKLISYRTDFFCMGIIAYYLYSNSYPFGNNKNKIQEYFKKSDLSVRIENPIITNFCNAVFKKNPSERPRKIESILKLLQQ